MKNKFLFAIAGLSLSASVSFATDSFEFDEQGYHAKFTRTSTNMNVEFMPPGSAQVYSQAITHEEYDALVAERGIAGIDFKAVVEMMLPALISDFQENPQDYTVADTTTIAASGASN